MKLISYPNIIQFFDIIEKSKRLYLVTDYASKVELFDYKVTNNCINEEQANKEVDPQ